MRSSILRISFLVSVAVLLIGLAFVVGDARYSAAQTAPVVLVDYDLDDDGLIEVRDRVFLQAMHFDLNGDGTGESRNGHPRRPMNPGKGTWGEAFVNAMPGAGCPPRDHDDDPSTPDEPSCIGYELINDIDASGQWESVIGKTTANTFGSWFNTKLVGNGFRIVDLFIWQAIPCPDTCAFINGIGEDGAVEGVGFVNPDMAGSNGAVIAAELRGKIIGSYIQDGTGRGSSRGGFVNNVRTGSDYAGLIAHSYVNGYYLGPSGNWHGGLARHFEAQDGDNRARCLNSYYSGNLQVTGSFGGTTKGLIAYSVGNGVQLDNCYGDNTSDNDTNYAWEGAGSANNALYTRSATQLKSPTEYTDAFQNWDDYSADGGPLAHDQPRTDFWHFGDSTTFPVLKGWGHDHTLAPARSLSGADTVNLCTRTLVVANEIIRHLNDSDVLSGVSPTPTPLNLTPCTSSTDTRDVSITNLTNLVVTSPSNTFNLSPDRTFPPSERLTTLDANDFAYLTNAAHFDLGGSDIESLPPRLFQGIPLRWLDLSNNKLTSLPADLFAGNAAVTAVGGNSLLLNGNSLTDTGLPGRIFDTLPHLNGLDLSDNSFTRINTRWFEKLNNLGRKAASNPPYTHALGLHLEGNTITEHHYSHKIFSGVRENVVPYADVSSPTATTGGDALRTAIVAAITAANADVTNLDLASTDYYVNSGGTVGYTSTACPNTGTAGPGRYAYLDNEAPDCYIQPHWTPPHKTSDTATATPAISGATASGSEISVQFTHTPSTAFVAYQIRYRPSTDDHWTPWLVVPIMDTSGAKNAAIPAVWYGQSYDYDLRALSTTGPPSSAATRSTFATSASWLTAFNATQSSTAVGAVDLSWTINSAMITSGHSVTAFYYRYKPRADNWYGPWRAVPDSADSGTSPSNETSYLLRGLSPGVTYDLQLATGVDDADADSTVDYFTEWRSDSANALLVPANLRASSGTAPGTIDLTWNRQTASTVASAKFQVRRKRKSTSWPADSPFGWTDVPDSIGPAGDSSTHTHDETSYTLTELQGGIEYDIQVRFFWSSSAGAQVPISTTATPTRAATPTGLTASQGTFGNIVLNWDQQSVSASSEARYQLRYKKTTDDWPATTAEGWVTIASAHSTNTFSIASLEGGVSYDFELRFLYSDAVGLSDATAVVGTTETVLTAIPSHIPGQIDISWTAQTQTTASNARFQTRARWAIIGGWTSWADVPDGSDADSHTYDETSGTATGLVSYRPHDVEVRLAIGTTAGPAARVNSVRAGYQPQGLRAVTGDAPGTIDVSWNTQTDITGQYRRFVAAAKLVTSNTWLSWTQVPDSGDPGTHTHDETSVRIVNLTAGALHDVRAMFNSGPGQHDWPDVNYIPMLQNIRSGIVPAPTNFTATTSTMAASAIDLSWDEQTASTESASKFQYRYKPTTTSAWTGVTWSDVGDGDDADSNVYNETGITVSSLTAGTSYDFQLRFYWDSTYEWSTTVSATATASVIPAPHNFSAASGTVISTIDLSWDLVSGATDYQYRYRLTTPASSAWGSWTQVPDSITDVGTSLADEDDYTISAGLTAGTSYTIELRARAGATAGGAASDTATAQTQLPPRNASFSPGTNAGEIDVSWDAPPGSATPTGYGYRYKLASASSYPSSGTGAWALVPDVNNNGDRTDDRSFTITSLWAGQSYNIQIRTVSATGNSQPGTDTTGTVTATPVAAPTGFTATLGDAPGEIDLAWTAIPTNAMPTGDTVVQYQYRTKLTSVASWGNWTNIAGATTTTHTITGLSTYTQYDVELRAAIDDGDDTDTTTANYQSSAASVIGTYSGLAVPANLRATPSTTIPSAINLAWNRQTVFTNLTASYDVRYKLQADSWPSGGGWSRIFASTHSTTSHTLTNLMNGQTYDIELRLFVDTTLGASAAASVVGTASIIAAPAGLTATPATTTAGAIDLQWNAQSVVTASTAEYQYRAKPTASTWPGSAPFGWASIPDSTDDTDSDAHNETAYTITGLTANTAYDIELRLFMSTASGSSSAITASATASSVPVPTGFEATTGSGAGEIDLAWTALTGATDYQYRCSPAGTGCSTTWTTAGSGTSHTIPNLTTGAFYNIQLRARIAGIGESAPTSAQRAQAQTTPGPDTLTLSQGPNPGDIKLDWTAPANNAPAEHYEYRYKLATAADSAYPTAYTKVPDSDNDNDFSDETTVTITGLQVGLRYHVQLRVYASQAIGFSLPQRGTQTPRPVPPPTALTATRGANPGEVELGWTAPTGVTVLRYEIRNRLGMTGAWSSWTSAGAADSYTYTGLMAGISHTFELRTVMQTIGASSAVSVMGTPTPVPAPSSFTASTGTFPGEIDLTWTPVNGATRYEYRVRPASTTEWPDESEWQSASGASTDTTLTLLEEGANYVIELRVVVTNVGISTAASAQATSRTASFTDRPTTPTVPTDYSVSAAEVPGRIAIQFPAGTDPFIYRYRTANPGDWSRWFKVTPQAADTRYVIPGLVPGVSYDIQVRIYTGTARGFTTALTQEAQAAPLVAPADFEASEISGVILLTWSSPERYTPDHYEYRTRPTGAASWSNWITLQHEGNQGATQRHYVTGLESGISHDFELRMTTQDVQSPTASSRAITKLRLPEVHSIRPDVREVTIRAGDTIRLTVNIYNAQAVLDNSVPQKPDSKLTFSWSDDGGGNFGEPNTKRMITYTAPSQPGIYTITAEAKPDGICLSHHDGESEITAADRAPCIATFTIRAVRTHGDFVVRPDPVNPPGVIPTTLTDDEGIAYSVFTPVDGGTFTGEGFTVSADAGAVPDRTIIGINASVSAIPPPTPVPGTSISIAGSFYEIKAITQAGTAPLPSYTLSAPATACLPFPDEFRATLSNVVLVSRAYEGALDILSTKVRTMSGELTVCGAVSVLPATVGVARLGLVPVVAPTPVPEQELPETGGAAPGGAGALVVLLLLAGVSVLVLTGMCRMFRMRIQ